MEPKEQQEVYDTITERFLKVYTDKVEEDYNEIIKDLFSKDYRSIIIIGSAYLEDILKSSLIETYYKKRRKKVLDKIEREMTFSFTNTSLYGQGYYSKEIYDLIENIRKIRNIYAHNPKIKQNELQKIKSHQSNLKKALDKGWFTRHQEEIEKLTDLDKKILIIIFENLIINIISLQMWIIPTQKLCSLELIDKFPYAKCIINLGEITRHTLNHFENKFGEMDLY